MDLDGPHTLAGAICYLAAAAHSKDPQEQQELAAAFWNDCVTDFRGVRISEKTEAVLLEMITKGRKK